MKFSPIKLLHLEDDLRDREMVRKAISGGLECEYQYAGNEAEFHVALESKPDVVLADHTLPGFDGVAALEIVRQRDSRLPFIFVTGSLSEAEAIETFKKGATDYILKDRMSRLRPAILRALRDVAEAERAFAADARIREQATLLQRAHDAILVCRLDGRIRFWNRSAERLYGVSAEEAEGKPMERLLFGGATHLRLAWETTLKTGKWAGEVSSFGSDGNGVFLESSWTLLRSEAGEPEAILIINTDVSEKKRLEEQFLRAQRMESIGILTGGIAHDLNNVLSPVMLGTQLLRGQNLDARSARVLEMIEQAVAHGADLIKEILTFARGVEGERTEIYPGQTVLETCKLLRETLPRSIEVAVNIEQGVWAIKAVPTQLKQILMNLCVNSRDAMPMGGKLEIRAANTTIDLIGSPENPDAKPGEYVTISVSDTGIGMPADILSKLYRPFFTTKAAGKGTGLGLSTVRNIVKSHEGFIEIHSEPGMGTTFKCYFPASRSGTKAADAKQTMATSPGKGSRVLVVDDDPGVAEAIRMILEHREYSVLSASNGVEALDVYRKHRDGIDLVITDIMMPAMDGSGFVEALRRENPAGKIIVVSGLLDHTALERFANFGGIETLRKPFTAVQLFAAVETVLHGGKRDN